MSRISIQSIKNNVGRGRYDDSRYGNESFYSNGGMHESFNTKIPIIPKTKFPYIHYLCPKCFNFPIINFLTDKFIYYTCKCKKDDEKYDNRRLIKIKDLFNKENQLMTFIENDISNELNKNPKEKFKGFKCIEKHDSEKIHKFRYFCTFCKNNICGECVQKHIDNRAEKHDFIVFDFNNPDIYKKIEEINNKINQELMAEENKEELNAQNLFDSSNERLENNEDNKIKSYQVNIIDKSTTEIIESENIEEDKCNYFIELINIIIRDFLTYPNYFHFCNIDNIYRFYMDEKKKDFNGIIKYKNKPNQEIRLFGKQFYERYSKKLKMIIEEKIYNLKEFHKFTTSNDFVEIYLVNEKSDYYFNFNYFNVSYMFHDCDSLMEIDNSFKVNHIESDISHLFDGCKSLIKAPSFLKSLSNIYFTDISCIFHNCSSLKSLPDISDWEIKNVKNMSKIFKGCKSLISIPDISIWETENAIDMSYMFNNCSSLLSLPDISKWDIRWVTNMISMFSDCSKLENFPNFSKWETKSLINISGMFCNCSSITSIEGLSNWNTEKINNISCLFYGCSKLVSLPDLSKWKTNNITNMSWLFNGCSSLVNLPDISGWKTDNIKDIKGMFFGCFSLKSLPDISKWNTKNVKNIKEINDDIILLKEKIKNLDSNTH